MKKGLLSSHPRCSPTGVDRDDYKVYRIMRIWDWISSNNKCNCASSNKVEMCL